VSTPRRADTINTLIISAVKTPIPPPASSMATSHDARPPRVHPQRRRWPPAPPRDASTTYSRQLRRWRAHCPLLPATMMTDPAPQSLATTTWSRPPASPASHDDEDDQPPVQRVDANPASNFLFFLFLTAPALTTTALPPPPASTAMAATPSSSVDYGGYHRHQRRQFSHDSHPHH